MENNLLGGTEFGQEKTARNHGSDVLSCSDNPGGAACQRGIAQNKAYIDAIAASGLFYMPAGMQIAAGLGGSVNATMQYLVNGSVNPTDVLMILPTISGHRYWLVDVLTNDSKTGLRCVTDGTLAA